MLGLPWFPELRVDCVRVKGAGWVVSILDIR